MDLAVEAEKEITFDPVAYIDLQVEVQRAQVGEVHLDLETSPYPVGEEDEMVAELVNLDHPYSRFLV